VYLDFGACCSNPAAAKLETGYKRYIISQNEEIRAPSPSAFCEFALK
jgi:hypothetical protein